jgi:flagellar basal body-associated protein FliL
MRIPGNLIINHLYPKWRRRPVFTRAALALIICAAQIIPTATINSQTPRSGGDSTAARQLNQEKDINAMFYKYELLDLNLEETARAARMVGRVALQLNGVKYDLELEQNNLLAPGYRAVITTDNGE